MNTCYCLRLHDPHPRTPECETYRIDRMIARRIAEAQWRAAFFPDWELDQDDNYAQQDREARNAGRKV